MTDSVDPIESFRATTPRERIVGRLGRILSFDRSGRLTDSAQLMGEHFFLDLDGRFF